MPAKIERSKPNVDTGTGEAKPMRIQTITVAADSEGPTGEAKSTLNRNVVVESGEPTGEAKPTRVQTITADWPEAPEVKTETKTAATPQKATSQRSTSKKPTRKASVRKGTRTK